MWTKCKRLYYNICILCPVVYFPTQCRCVYWRCRSAMMYMAMPLNRRLPPKLSRNKKTIGGSWLANRKWRKGHRPPCHRCWWEGWRSRRLYGNEIADLAAGDALGLDIPKFPYQFVPFTDLRRKTNSYCFQLWQERWSSLTNNKLFRIRPDLSKPFPMAVLTRKEETILARLHTGHTYFTHVHILKREEPPWCHACDNIYSVKHIMSECADLYDLRERFFGKMEMKDIFTDIPTANLFGFLKETDLFYKI